MRSQITKGFHLCVHAFISLVGVPAHGRLLTAFLCVCACFHLFGGVFSFCGGGGLAVSEMVRKSRKLKINP